MNTYTVFNLFIFLELIFYADCLFNRQSYSHCFYSRESNNLFFVLTISNKASLKFIIPLLYLDSIDV